MDTLPSAVPNSGCGQRVVTPAFGYGSPHLGARGTSTLLNNALLSAHYGLGRLLAPAQHRHSFRHKARSPQAGTHSFTARPPDLRHRPLVTRASRSVARSPWSARPSIRFLFIGPQPRSGSVKFRAVNFPMVFRGGRCGAEHMESLAWMGSGKRPALRTVAAQEERRFLPGTKRSELHEVQPPAAARAGRFAAKSAPAGQRQIRTISVRRIQAGNLDDCLPAPASASGSGKNGFGRFTVNAACCVDLFWIYRGSLRLSTPWPWRRPVAAVPIPPCPVTRGPRA